MDSLVNAFSALGGTAPSAPTHQALYDFVPQMPQELPLRQGQSLVLLESHENGWSKVQTDKTGLVPTSYIQPLPATAVPPPSKEQALAQDHNECVICCEEMPSAPCAVLLNANKKRACRHFLHARCAQDMLTGAHHDCPVCRTPFVSILPVPELEQNPRAWFKLVDFDGNGQLSRSEVLDVLKTFLQGVEAKRMEAEFAKYWTTWDKDGSGELSFAELCDPKTGMMADFKQRFQKPPQTVAAAAAAAPKLSQNTLREWFEYWDEDKSGCLDREEIVRALIKTFGLSTDLSRVNELRETVGAIWGAFDFDGSGSLSEEEFIQPGNGLGESLIANLHFHK